MRLLPQTNKIINSKIMVTKKVLAEKVQEALEAKGVKLSVEKSIIAVNTVFNEITKAVAAGDEARIDSFGTFKSVDKAERAGRNPRTGETITIAAHKDVVFKAGKALKDSVNNK